MRWIEQIARMEEINAYDILVGIREGKTPPLRRAELLFKDKIKTDFNRLQPKLA
jgi:hypothetical protein